MKTFNGLELKDLLLIFQKPKPLTEKWWRKVLLESAYNSRYSWLCSMSKTFKSFWTLSEITPFKLAEMFLSETGRNPNIIGRNGFLFRPSKDREIRIEFVKWCIQRQMNFGWDTLEFWKNIKEEFESNNSVQFLCDTESFRSIWKDDGNKQYLYKILPSFRDDNKDLGVIIPGWYENQIGNILLSCHFVTTREGRLAFVNWMIEKHKSW